jgi:hypothetical protein
MRAGGGKQGPGTFRGHGDGDENRLFALKLLFEWVW